MGKKNRINKLFESTPIESVNAHPEPAQSVPEEQHDDATPVSPEPRDEQPPRQDEEIAAPTEPIPAGQPTDAAPIEARGEQEGGETSGEIDESVNAAEDESSTDDILEDVRRSLIEEEEDKEQKDSKWWQRFGRKGKKPELEPVPVPLEIDLPDTTEAAEVAEMREQPEDAEAESDEIDDLINMLAAETTAPAAEGTAAPEMESVVEPEPVIDFEELKKQAFQPRAGDAASEELSDVRSIALAGGEEVLVEVESKPVNPVEERMSAFENALRPYRRYIYSALALLGVAMAVTASLILYNIYQQSRPEPVRDPNMPYPTGVSLPGGWSFNLGTGSLVNGRWDPAGPEWLDGTEVCRWVALPWSTQLEAVVRTLNPKDPIELSMSNNDRLVYKVYSIRELSPEEMQQLDSSSPCLLLILTRSDSERRWVVTALP
jgi:hypothetical protein